jgi:hypothetical protein
MIHLSYVPLSSFSALLFVTYFLVTLFLFISSAAVPRTTEHTAEGKVILKNNLQLCVLMLVFLLVLGHDSR